YDEKTISDPTVKIQLSFLNDALVCLIKKRVSDDAVKNINKIIFSLNNSSNSAFKILVYLKGRYDRNNSRISFKQNYGWITNYQSMTYEDLFREITSMMETLLNYDEYELALLNTIPKDDQAKFILRKENLIKQSTAGMMLGCLPEHIREGYFKQWGHTADFQTDEIVDIVVGSNVNNSQPVNHGFLANAYNKNYKKENRDKKPHFRKQKTKPKCLYCGKPHKPSECKRLFQDNPDAEVFKTFGPPNLDEELFCAFEYTIQEKPETWIWDSGASTHMCCNKQFFMEYKELKIPDYVKGIGGSLPIIGYGKVKMNNMELTRVAYVPDLGINLISPEQAFQDGVKYISMTKDRLKIYLKTRKDPIVIKKKGKFFTQENTALRHAPPIKLTEQTFAFLTYVDPMLPRQIHRETKASTMHARLGHPNFEVYNVMAKSMNLPKIDRNKWSSCPTCNLSKGLNYKGQLSKTKYTAPLQLVQIDLCGNFTYSNPSKYSYFLTIVDKYTRMYFTYPIHRKHQSAEVIISWIKEVENFFSSRGGYKVGTIRTDNGKEIVNEHLLHCLDKRGIIHQLTVPYNSFQNGGAERAHRSLEEKTRCLLIGGRVYVALGKLIHH
ncbi:DDE-type integrase/transposase/recombinase, partial [Streptomyces deserti]